MTAGSSSAAAAVSAYSGVYVFGDSLVDPGNDYKVAQTISSFPFVSLPNGAPTPDKGYFMGRFSDGYNFADLVSNKLIHVATQPTFPYGVSSALLGVSLPSVGKPDGNNLSFAYGGAEAIQGSEPAPSLGAQMGIYSHFTPDPNALYVVSIGSNDVLSLVPTGGTPVTGAAATAALTAVANEITSEVTQLVARGARHVVVANVPDLGITPAYTGEANEAASRALVTQYAQTVDGLLKTDLAGISAPSGGSVTDYDFFAYSDAVAANPAAYGFTNVTQALTTVQPTSPDPTGDGFLFFDKLHPTAQAHAQIAAEILQSLANPGVNPTASWTPAASIGARAGAMLAQGGSDAFTASLTAGHAYVVDALGVSSGSGTLSDPTVEVLNSSGAVVAQADDGGLGLDSHLTFTAPTTGDYSVVVQGVGVSEGSFHLQVGDSSGANLLTSGLVAGSNVTINGGPADETLTAAAGSNILTGGQGADSITGGTGFDAINGNKGDDTIVGRSQTGDWLLGGQGDDSINAAQSTGHNLIFGNLGNDTLVGGAGADTLRGGQADDVITAGSGPDWISGDLGHNTITAGAGADTFHGSAGTDLIDGFSLAHGDRVLLDPGVTYTLSTSGSDTVVQLSNGGQMTLVGVQETSLTTGWILTG